VVPTPRYGEAAPVFDKPNKDAVVRSLSAVVGKSEEMAAESRFRVQGDPNNSRTLLSVAKAVDEVHAELLGKAMTCLASYVGQVDASAKEMTAWARPELERMATLVLGQIQSAVFADQANAYRKQYKGTFEERLDLALAEFEFGRVNGRAIEATPSGPRRSQEAPSARPDYVSEVRLEALRAAKSSAFDMSKLIRLCEELNSNWSAGNYYSVVMLVRTITDHVPPIFGARSFKEVAAQGGQSFKGQMDQLENSSRKIAGMFLHTHIRRNDVPPTDTQVWFAPALETLLGEVVVELAEKARAEALAAAEKAERPVVTVGGDYKKIGSSVFEEDGKRFFRLEVGNYGKTAATLTYYDVRFASLKKVQTTQNDVSRRWRFDDLIAPDTRHRVIRDDVEIDPPDAEVVYGAFWYKTAFHKNERISCFVFVSS
jgi:hypothetical protein